MNVNNASGYPKSRTNQAALSRQLPPTKDTTRLALVNIGLEFAAFGRSTRLPSCNLVAVEK